MNRFLIPLLWLLCSLSPPARAADETVLDWQPFESALFEQARQQHKPVFLYLEAVWCHWCHVMQRTTFQDSAVQQALAAHWLIARVDHDADPLLANRYRDFGWPALIFFNPEGQEIAKRAGYVDATDFNALLDTLAAHPEAQTEAASAGGSSTVFTTLPDELRSQLQAEHREAYDPQRGGLRLAMKFIDRDSVEYALTRAMAGDATEARRVRQTLHAAQGLIDPVWGGAYQYSTRGDWAHPHYEKIMRTQAAVLRSAALAYGQSHRREDRRMAEAVRDYLLRFLRAPDGGFYVSQDADAVPGEKATAYFALPDAARRRLGLPRIDRHEYAQETGLAIESLVQWHRASGDPVALAAALTAAQWAQAQRARSDGRFAHEDDEGRYLGDTLYMGRAALALFSTTQDTRWRDLATQAASAIAQHFAARDGGYLTAVAEGAVLPPPRINQENIDAARFFAHLAIATDSARWLDDSRHALRWLAQPEVAASTLTEPGILLAAGELAAAERRFSDPSRNPGTAATRR